MAYDSDRSYITLGDATGVSIAGTNAAASEQFRLRIPRAMVVDEASVVAMTGGTAAGPNIVLGKSLAGTGAVAGFGTHNFGTAANNTGAAITITATSFDAGDHLVLQIAAGTAASTPKACVLVGYHFGVS